jgi:hypothetical protein
MKHLLKDATADVTGEWFPVDYGKDWVMAITSTADFGGGTLTIELRDRETGEDLTGDPGNLQFTAAFAPTGLVLGAGMEVRATLSGSTSPNIKGVHLYSAGQ